MAKNAKYDALLKATNSPLVAMAEARAVVIRAQNRVKYATERAAGVLERAADGEVLPPEQVKAAESILDRGGVPKGTTVHAEIEAVQRPLVELSDAELQAIIEQESASSN